MNKDLRDCDIRVLLNELYSKRDFLWNQHQVLNRDIKELEDLVGVK